MAIVLVIQTIHRGAKHGSQSSKDGAAVCRCHVVGEGVQVLVTVAKTLKCTCSFGLSVGGASAQEEVIV